MNKKILIVEDDEANLLLLYDILSFNSFKVYKASDGKTAINTALTTKPDIILMDMLMPVMDGIEATRILKDDKRTKDIPVIALTAFAMKGDKEKMINAGCNDYLVKPFNIDSLLEIVNKYIQ